MYFCGYRFGSKVSMKNLGRAETGSYPGTTPNISATVADLRN
jgi:hypothetical protein